MVNQNCAYFTAGQTEGKKKDFFFEAHSLILLFCMVVAISYTAIFHNMKRKRNVYFFFEMQFDITNYFYFFVIVLKLLIWHEIKSLKANFIKLNEHSGYPTDNILVLDT